MTSINSSNKVRVRFAPSPTGNLHVGGLRTALFNYLFARHNNGEFILRIEDTDKAREVAGTDKDIILILKEFGLDFDEGPFYQSQRLEIYERYAEELIKKGFAYKDSTSPQPSPRQGRGYVVRQIISKEGSTTFEDLVYGKITIENSSLDEGVLLKSDGFPVYNFANVIDDHEMGITHVIRGEEFIPSTPKHILLYQAFGWEVPKFAHLPLILDKERKKLSKRTGDVAVNEYLKKGYLKEAILNFIALLGWNPKTTQEVFSLEELIKEFSLEKVNKAAAIFDIEKLDFINREWQKRLNLGTKEPMNQKTRQLLSEKFGDLSRPPATLSRPGEGLGERSKNIEQLLELIWPLILERVKGPSELEAKLPEFYFFFETPEYESRLLIWKDTPEEKIKNNLIKLRDFIAQGKARESEVKEFINSEKMTTGEALWPLRVALSGLQNSPGPFDILNVFSKLPDGNKIINERLAKAIAKFDKK